MLIAKKPFTLTKILLMLYVFRFVFIAGSENISSMFNYIGELVILGFLIDVVALKNRINWSAFQTITPYIMFLSLMFISIIWYPKGNEYIFDIFTKYLLFFICFFVVSSSNSFDFIFYAILMACLSIFIIGYDEISEYILNPVNRRFNFNSIDDEGGINPNALAFYCNTTIGFLIYKFRTIEKKHLQLSIVGLISIFVFLIVYVTLSRKGIIGIVFMYFFYLLSGKRKNIMTNISVTIASLIGLVFLAQNLDLPIMNRFVSTINLLEGGTNIGESDYERTFLFFESINFWNDSPFFGNGIKHFENNSALGLYTHINYIELLTNYGMVGLMLFYFPIIRKVRFLYLNYNQISFEIKFFFYMLLFILIYDFAMVSYYNIIYLLIISTILGYQIKLSSK